MKLQIQLEQGIPLLCVEGVAVAALAGTDGLTVGLAQAGQAVRLEVLGEEGRPGLGLRYQGGGLPGGPPAWSVRDEFEPLGEGLLGCRRTWTNLGEAPQRAALVFELQRLQPPEASLIPAVNYNGNTWGAGSEPKGTRDGASQGQPDWVYGGDRSSLPACSITLAGGWLVGLYTLPELAAHSGCALAQDGQAQQVWWPLQELPRSYVGRDLYQPAIRGEVEVAGGGSVSRGVCIALCPGQNLHGLRPLIDGAWRQFYRPFPAPFSPAELWRLGIRFAKESLWYEREGFRGFVLGQLLVEGEWVLPTWNLAEVGWCGQNATYAAMMLQDYLWHQDEDSWSKGEAALDCWMEQCALPNGLFYTHIDDVLAGRREARLETCNLGGGAFAYFLAADLAEAAGRPRPAWRELALRLCDFFVGHALPDGRFGRYWDTQGQLLEADGTVGSWIIWPLLRAYRATGRAEYLRAAQRGFEVYSAEDLARFTITAGALDTDCIDKEGAFPLLIAALELHELTGEAGYLVQAERAALYLATWQWHYHLDYPAGTAAAQLGYETFGGTSVSVQHHHLDPWGALIALGWLRLGQQAGDALWGERAAAAWRQAACGVSDGSLRIDGILRPAGGQDEGFLHTRWGREVGGVSNWLVAWPGAFRLLVLQQWKDWDALA